MVLPIPAAGLSTLPSVSPPLGVPLVAPSEAATCSRHGEFGGGGCRLSLARAGWIIGHMWVIRLRPWGLTLFGGLVQVAGQRDSAGMLGVRS